MKSLPGVIGLVVLMTGLIGCAMGSRNQASRETIAATYGPIRDQPMGITNRTQCEACPDGLALTIYYGDKLVAEKMPPGEWAKLSVPPTPFEVTIVAHKDGVEFGRRVEPYPAYDYAVNPFRPSRVIRYHDFM